MACRLIVGEVTTVQVGQWVRDRIKARKLSVQRVSDVSGVSRSAIYDLMDGKHPPSVETQHGLAKALGVKPDWADRIAAGKSPVEVREPDVSQLERELRQEIVLLQHQIMALGEKTLVADQKLEARLDALAVQVNTRDRRAQ